MKIAQLLNPQAICSDLESSGKMDVLLELSSLVAKNDVGLSEQDIATVLIERERLATTGVGEGVAIPHAKLDHLDSLCAAIGVSRTGVAFDAIDGKPVHIFVALLAPQGSTGEHLKALAGISRLLKEPEFRKKVLGAGSAEGILAAIEEEERETE